MNKYYNNILSTKVVVVCITSYSLIQHIHSMLYYVRTCKYYIATKSIMISTTITTRRSIIQCCTVA
jgi:hypothetical protein